MANEWTDSSFELNLPGLTLEGAATRVNAPGAWPDGDWGLTLTGAPGSLGGPAVSSRARRTIDTPTPGLRVVRMQVSANGDPASAPLVAELRTVGGGVLATFTLDSGSVAFALWAAGSFAIAPVQAVVELRCEAPSLGAGCTWAVDLVEVNGPEDVDMAKVLEIRDAILVKLATVLTANGYSVDLTVYDGWRALSSCKLPCAQVVMLGESKTFAGPERSALQRKEGIATFRIGYFAKATDFDGLYQTAADGEKALETASGGQQLGLPYVRLVSVSDNDTFETEELIAQGQRALFQDVDVTYQHQRAQP